MAHNAYIIDGPANASIARGQFLKYASGGWVPCSAQGEAADGIAFSDASQGDAVAVQIGGLVMYKVGPNPITDGAYITTTAGGLGEIATTSDVARLKAVGAGAAGAYATALWVDNYVVPS